MSFSMLLTFIWTLNRDGVLVMIFNTVTVGYYDDYHFRPSRCGGCRAMWYVDGQEVDCYEQYGVDVREYNFYFNVFGTKHAFNCYERSNLKILLVLHKLSLQFIIKIFILKCLERQTFIIKNTKSFLSSLRFGVLVGDSFVRPVFVLNTAQ